VADQFQVDEDELVGPRRSRQVALPRQVAMYLLREETNASLPAIGDALGGRDHTTVLYGYEKISDLIETDDFLRKQVSAIRQSLHA
jgi:chromosomal replication initiator protein